MTRRRGRWPARGIAVVPLEAAGRRPAGGRWPGGEWPARPAAGRGTIV